MKDIKTTFTALLIFFSFPLSAQEELNSAMVFETYEWDFGHIKEADGVVQHTFRFMNISNNPIQIDNVATSCGCTTVQYSTEPVAGGHEGYVTILFDPTGTEDHVIRGVEIFTRDRRNYASIIISADVEPIPMGLNEQYPYFLAENIKTNSKSFPFGYITQGNIVTKIVRLANVGDKTIHLSAITTPNKYGMSVECPEYIEPQSVVSMRVTYSIPQSPDSFGMTRDTIWIVSDNTKGDVPLAVSALRVEEFTSTTSSDKPVMRIEPSYVDFGKQSPGSTVSKTIEIENTGNADLIFRDIATTDNVKVSISTGHVIRSGKKSKVNVRITNSQETGTTTMGSIYLTTNDPSRPWRELRLEVNTK